MCFQFLRRKQNELHTIKFIFIIYCINKYVTMECISFKISIVRIVLVILMSTYFVLIDIVGTSSR